MQWKQTGSCPQTDRECLPPELAAEQIVLSAIAQGRLADSSVVDSFQSRLWLEPDHTAIFEALRALASASPIVIRGQLPAVLTRKGFPDIDIDFLFEALPSQEEVNAAIDTIAGKRRTNDADKNEIRPGRFGISLVTLRRFTLIEVIALPLFIELFIWKLQFSNRSTWIIFPVWITLSFFLHRDNPKTLGWRADNLWPAIKQSVAAFGLMAAGLVAVGFFLGAARTSPAPLMAPSRLWDYFAFCLLQQVALNSLVNNRLLFLTPRRWLSSILTGIVFAICHWPNPVLVPLTFVAGCAMGWLFARCRNIIPLAIGQAVLGSIVLWSFPMAWQHHLRVGPGYYDFKP